MKKKAIIRTFLGMGVFFWISGTALALGEHGIHDPSVLMREEEEVAQESRQWTYNPNAPIVKDLRLEYEVLHMANEAKVDGDFDFQYSSPLLRQIKNSKEGTASAVQKSLRSISRDARGAVKMRDFVNELNTQIRHLDRAAVDARDTEHASYFRQERSFLEEVRSIVLQEQSQRQNI